MQIRRERLTEANLFAWKILDHKEIYKLIESKTQVPWFFTALCHYRESTLNFKTYLGNGELLSVKTTLEPKGRGPFKTFEEGAYDALMIKGWVDKNDWTIERISYRLEGFNGYGYHDRGVNSPYLYGGSNLYGPPEAKAGKYTRDHFFDPNVVDKQLGTLVILKRLIELDETIAIKTEENLNVKTISSYVKDGQVVGIGSNGPVVAQIQQALIDDGAVLVVDGDFGQATEIATRAFQARHNLTVDGYVGSQTALALDQVEKAEIPVRRESLIKEAPWLAKMRALTGTKEIPGSEDSPIIMSWRGDIAKAFPEMASYVAGYTNDLIPWCGLTVAECMASSGIKPPFSEKENTESFLYALAWANWGVKLSHPEVGCVMVFSRAGGGHVALLEKLDGNTAYIRGGNQADMINVTKKSMSTFVAAVWPKDWPIKVDLEGDVRNYRGQGSEA